MKPIIIPFKTNSLGRIMFNTGILAGDYKSTKDVEFKFDSGSDFTTIHWDVLTEVLEFSEKFLDDCPFHHDPASAAGTKDIPLQYITNMSMKFGDRELQGVRIFFAKNTEMRSLLGSDVLKYFNWDVNYDKGIFQLAERETKPLLSKGEERPIEIYSLENLIQLKS